MPNEVSIEGSVKRLLAEGALFGELALIYAKPRTATVSIEVGVSSSLDLHNVCTHNVYPRFGQDSERCFKYHYRHIIILIRFECVPSLGFLCVIAFEIRTIES